MAANKNQQNPRQKMINLMYVVLMAMLALNISTEVLNGFTIVDESLQKTTSNSDIMNDAIYKAFQEELKTNPKKIKANFDKATEARRISDELYRFVDSLKWAIVREADGKDADVKDIENKDDLEAASHVMLAPGTGKGEALFNAINIYRERILKMITKLDQYDIINSNLSTKVPKTTLAFGKNWQEYHFENMPVAAAVTQLSKLQSDIRYAEGEVLHALAEESGIISMGPQEAKVNNFQAFVIPNAQTLTRGSKFQAKIVMAAIDSTQRPRIFVGGRQISSNGIYETVTTHTGDFTLSGFIEMLASDSTVIRRQFTQKYTVVEPTATVSADLMNVLYAGYDNPVSVSVPGVPLNQVTMSMTGGSLSSKGNGKYVARPSTPGSEITFTVVSHANGGNQQMGQFKYKVRKLPDPTAFIDLGGGDRFKGGSLAKGQLLNLSTLSAAIDDGLLDIPFRVISFEAVFFDQMGNAIPQKSEGATFSAKQKNMFRSLSRGKRFYISHVIATGPDGIQRTLPQAMEIIVK
ncbi:MAG: gliding motility protein GldM [Prevotella sp.]|nr:gliding motility protein GldM [Candidatus Equicola faecalis]